MAASETTVQIKETAGPGLDGEVVEQQYVHKGGGGGHRKKIGGAEAGDEAVKALKEVCPSSDGSPTTLDLFNKQLQGEGVTKLVNAMIDDETTIDVQVLNLSTNKLGNRGAAAVALLVSTKAGAGPLESLDLQMNRIASEGAEKLCMALHRNTTLQTLHISSNDLGVEGAAWLAAALAVNSTLKTLSFDYNMIGDEGADRIAEGLSKNIGLSKLALRGNEIGERGGKSLATSLQSNSTLTFLDMDANEIEDAGAEAFLQMLVSNQVLLQLSVFGCGISPLVAKSLRDTLATRGESPPLVTAAGGGYPITAA
jgi:hypothetical protein